MSRKYLPFEVERRFLTFFIRGRLGERTYFVFYSPLQYSLAEHKLTWALERNIPILMIYSFSQQALVGRQTGAFRARPGLFENNLSETPLIPQSNVVWLLHLAWRLISHQNLDHRGNPDLTLILLCLWWSECLCYVSVWRWSFRMNSV